MSKAKKFLALLLCLALFVTSLMLSFFLSRDDVGDFHGDGTGHIVLSEILPSNRTYPNRAGQYLDYIELRNLTATPTDISFRSTGIYDGLDVRSERKPEGKDDSPRFFLSMWRRELRLVVMET